MPEKAVPNILRMQAPEGESETSLLRRKTIVIGRGVECDVVIKDTKASRTHCRLTRSGVSFVLEDLGSSNGTFVDGKKIGGPVELSLNHTFKIGDTIFYLSPQSQR